MKSCEPMAPLLVSRPLGLLEPAGEARLEAHLPGCAGCQAFARDVALALEGARLPEVAPAPAGEDPPGWAALAERIAADRRADGVRVSLSCTYCHDALERSEAVYCAACLAPHHEECFRDHAACSAPGCAETQVVRPGALPVAAAPRRVARLAVPAAIAAALGVGMVAALVPEPSLPPAQPVAPVAPAPGKSVTIDSQGAEGDVSVAWPDASPLPPIDAMVLGLRADSGPALVTLSVGSDDGVEVGHRFRVYRGEETVGEVRVEEVRPDGCTCRAVSGGGPIQLGDSATLTGSDYVRIKCQDQDVRFVCRRLAQLADMDIILPPELHGRVTLDIERVHCLRALVNVLETTGEFQLVEESDRLLRVVPTSAIQDQRGGKR